MGAAVCAQGGGDGHTGVGGRERVLPFWVAAGVPAA